MSRKKPPERIALVVNVRGFKAWKEAVNALAVKLGLKNGNELAISLIEQAAVAEGIILPPRAPARGEAGRATIARPRPPK